VSSRFSDGVRDPSTRVICNARSVNPKLKTRQEFQKECDVNEIVRKAQGAVAPQYIGDRPPEFRDNSDVPTLAQAHEQVRAAREMFDRLPARMRRELGNNPGELESAPREMFERYGLLKPKPPTKADLDGVEGGTPSPEPKAKGKAPKAPKVDPNSGPDEA